MNTVFKGVVIGGDTHAGCVMRCLRHGTLSQKRSFFCSNKCMGIIIDFLLDQMDLLWRTWMMCEIDVRHSDGIDTRDDAWGPQKEVPEGS